MEKEATKPKQEKSDKKQTEILIGIALLIIGAVIIFTAAYQPRIKTGSSLLNESVLSSAPVSSKAYTTDRSADNAFDDNDDVLVLNLNTCTAEDLIKLSGIGESKANAIIAYRNVIGSYTDTEQIKNISGISDKIYENIKDNLTV